MSSFRQRGPENRSKAESFDDEREDLVVIGYSNNIYPNDERAEFIAEERHLVPWNGTDLLVDRYDCRLFLHEIDEERPGKGKESDSDTEEEECSNEHMEEEMCDEERYKDLFFDIEKKAREEEEAKQKRAEIGFNYGGSNGGAASSSDSEAEPFEAPDGIKLPVGLECPPNQKLNHIILRTAGFVVEKGPQMEIVIKAKQRNNADQFGFLEFDHPLNSYYKYMMKMIREKKYKVPDFSKRVRRMKRLKEEMKKQQKETGATKKSMGALAAIVTAHGSDSSDSDSDCELHPSLLLSRRRRKSATPDPLDNSASGIGPRKKPASPPPKPASATNLPNIAYKIGEANDIYASLFKSLSSLKEDEREKRENEARNSPARGTPPHDDVDTDFQQWWSWFYGRPCTIRRPSPPMPPPPDLTPVVESYAEYSAKHGYRGEQVLAERALKENMPINFLLPESPHHSYYQIRVRYIQWQLGIYPPHHVAAGAVASATETVVNSNSTSSEVVTTVENVDAHAFAHSPSISLADVTTAPPPPATASAEDTVGVSVHQLHVVASEPVLGEMDLSVPPPPPPLNRKQRRRLQDAPKVQTTLPPSVFDPIGVCTGEPSRFLQHSVSSPALALIGELGKVSPAEKDKEKAITTTAIITTIRERSESPDIEETTAALMDEASQGVQSESLSRSASPTPISFSIVPKKPTLHAKVGQPQQSGALPSLAPFPLVPVPAPNLTTAGASQTLIPPVPTPPPIQNDVQLERKEKARLFMEKLLNEKRMAKKKLEEEEERKRKEQEMRDAEIAKMAETLIEEGEIPETTESKGSERRGKEAKKEREERRTRHRARSPSRSRSHSPLKTVDLIDKLISSKISNLLENKTGIKLHATEEGDASRSPSQSVKESEKVLLDESDGESKEKKKRKKHSSKKEHKKKESKKRSRSRSRTPSDNKKRRRHSRSRSRSRERRHRH